MFIRKEKTLNKMLFSYREKMSSQMSPWWEEVFTFYKTIKNVFSLEEKKKEYLK